MPELCSCGGGHNAATGLGVLVIRSPNRNSRRRQRGLPGSWRIPVVGSPWSSTPVGLQTPGQLGAGVLSPQSLHRRPQQCEFFRGSITRRSHSLSTLRSCRYRTATQDSLPTGGQPLSGGSRTRRDPFQKVSGRLSYCIFLPPSPGLAWRTGISIPRLGDLRGC